MQNSTHAVVIEGAEVHKRFVQWDGGEAAREWACLSVLAEHAPDLAPRPLRRTERDGAPVVVMQRLPGLSLGGAPLTAEQTTALGAALRRLYDVPLAAVRSAGITERRYGPTTLAPTLVEWLAADLDLSPCRDPEAVRATVGIAREWLVRSPATHAEPSVLGIADLNPANLLWDGEAIRLVDFEDGGLSDPAYELADHVEHLANRLPGIHDGAALVDAVGLDEAERRRMQAYRPLWAAFWLAMLLPGNGGWRRNPPGTTEAQAAHVRMLLGA